MLYADHVSQIRANIKVLKGVAFWQNLVMVLFTPLYPPARCQCIFPGVWVFRALISSPTWSFQMHGSPKCLNQWPKEWGCCCSLSPSECGNNPWKAEGFEQEWWVMVSWCWGCLSVFLTLPYLLSVILWSWYQCQDAVERRTCLWPSYCFIWWS